MAPPDTTQTSASSGAAGSPPGRAPAGGWVRGVAGRSAQRHRPPGAAAERSRHRSLQVQPAGARRPPRALTARCAVSATPRGRSAGGGRAALQDAGRREPRGAGGAAAHGFSADFLRVPWAPAHARDAARWARCAPSNAAGRSGRQVPGQRWRRPGGRARCALSSAPGPPPGRSGQRHLEGTRRARLGQGGLAEGARGHGAAPAPPKPLLARGRAWASAFSRPQPFL